MLAITMLAFSRLVVTSSSSLRKRDSVFFKASCSCKAGSIHLCNSAFASRSLFQHSRTLLLDSCSFFQHSRSFIHPCRRTS
ncbi:hypothetical protein FKM82_026431 [Ascaphus truei]